MGPIEALRARYLSGEANAADVLKQALAHSNSNAGRNVYLAQDQAWSREELHNLRREDIASRPLWGVPVSLKDCFELAGFRTSCGSKFYTDTKGMAAEDSAVASRLRSSGAIITGKTHLHQLAYGITGENLDFGDCVQPHDPCRLTGGSSSGAAASVQEGSAMAAIGTDTGGSIRVPAALCGLAGYRSSITLQGGLWRGGAHLAATFDTIGWLYRDLADGPMLARVLFDLQDVTTLSSSSMKIGVPDAAFLHDCETDVLHTLHSWSSELATQGATFGDFDAAFWSDAFEILAGIQAHEAAVLHQGNFRRFEASIAERLAWGASLSLHDVGALRQRLTVFRKQMGELLQRFDYLLLPCAPMSFLAAGADHSQTRVRILRYTAPMSLAGSPVVTLPGAAGGLQLVGRVGKDAELLELSAGLSTFATRLRQTPSHS